MTSYWDLYIAYINECIKLNKANGIDPHHYVMEWNHTLPRCVFGEQPLGQYLTIRQHAVATALQTIALERNCLCGWHKQYLPEWLIELVWPYYVKSKKELLTDYHQDSERKSADQKRYWENLDPIELSQVLVKKTKNMCKPVQVTTPNGFIGTYPSLAFTALAFGVKFQNLHKYCKYDRPVKQGVCKGYTFEYI